MIKIDEKGVTVSGRHIEVLTEFGVLIRQMYSIKGMNKDGVLTDLICAVMKDSTESIEIIEALSKPNLTTE